MSLVFMYMYYVGPLSRSKCLHMQYSAVTQHKESILAMCSAMTNKKYINYTVIPLKSG